jgi:hypothetical protein
MLPADDEVDQQTLINCQLQTNYVHKYNTDPPHDHEAPHWLAVVAPAADLPGWTASKSQDTTQHQGALINRHLWFTAAHITDTLQGLDHVLRCHHWHGTLPADLQQGY